ncbi:MAG: proteasome accessory factor PafA2 family protein [bacterium]|nr:proteasome accessory factor PafA2 family protein [bacterium]
MPQKIIIGSETEYGSAVFNRTILVKQQLFWKHEANRLMLDVVGEVTKRPVFRGDQTTFSDTEEHESAEKEAEDNRDTNDPELLHAQRRGETGIMSVNGSRDYEDMTNFEHSCPEVTNPYDAVAFQKAGDFITNECRRRIEDDLRRALKMRNASLKIFKNNSDGKGHSYGAHECYSLRRETFSYLCDKHVRMGEAHRNALMLFLIARQIITGSGKIGSEHKNLLHTQFQISQRADFIELPWSRDTTNNRGIINTRDISYTDTDLARLHLIVGDSNMSELSLFLKLGMTALFIQMLDSGFLFSRQTIFGTPLIDPVSLYHHVSRDLTLREPILFLESKQKTGKKTALEIMYEFALLAASFSEEYQIPYGHAVVEHLKEALNGLSGNRHEHSGSASLDWVLKESALEEYAKKHQVPLDHKLCLTLGLFYHAIDPEKSVFAKLDAQGRVKHLVEVGAIERAVYNPPTDTRAWVRANIVERYADSISFMRWNLIVFKDEGEKGRVEINLGNPFLGKTEVLESLFGENLPCTDFISKLETLGIRDIVVTHTLPGRDMHRRRRELWR